MVETSPVTTDLKKADLLAIAADAGLELDERATKADIVAALEAASPVVEPEPAVEDSEGPTELVDGQEVDIIEDDTKVLEGADDPAEPTDDVDVEAQRAAALANITGGGDADSDESVGGTDASAPLVHSVAHTGVVHEWGGEVGYLVVADLFQYPTPDGDAIVARKGDVVKISDPERGLSLNVLVSAG